MDKKKTKKKSTKKNKKKRVQRKRKISPKLLAIITFFTGVLVIVSSYAWLSASLNVKVRFFNLVVSSNNGLFISLDGINFSDSVELDVDSVIRDLRNTYPNHTNQWAYSGLWPISTNGILGPNSSKFALFAGDVVKERGKGKDGKKFLNTRQIDEDTARVGNLFIAFDLFLKNVTGSPYSDNIYFDAINIDFTEDTSEETRESMGGILNSIRMGFLKMSSTSSKSAPAVIQNLGCNNACQALIYEPNRASHTQKSIDAAKEHGVDLVDGVAIPTYAVIKAGNKLVHANGHAGIPLDTEHFALQNTIVDEDFEEPIFQIPDGITKFRVYVWIEGQDMDSLETNSVGADIAITLDIVKDLASYR